MSVSRLYVDANIMIALAEGSPEIQPLILDLFIKKGRPEFLCTSELTLAEVLVHPYRHKDDKLIDLYDGWLAPGGFLDVGPVDRQTLQYAALLRSGYSSIKLPDAIHLVTAIGFRCSHFLTADNRLPRRIDVPHTRWNITWGSAGIDVIAPTPDVLEPIIEAPNEP